MMNTQASIDLTQSQEDIREIIEWAKKFASWTKDNSKT